MRIQTPDGSSFIQIDRRDEDYPIFDIAAVIGGFSGRNKRVVFEHDTEFLSQLRAFDATRKGAVTLEGSEQFRLTISTFDNAGHMEIGIRFSRSCYPRTGVTLEGKFDFDVEYASQIFSELHTLLRA